MTTRVPIGTHPGLVSALVGADLPVGSLAASEDAVRVFLRRTDHAATGSVVADLRNATGGGGDGITVTLGDAVASATATGTLTGTDFYLRVTAADASSMNLSGWVELEPSVGAVTSALTTLARVKEFLGITGATDDALISSIVLGVSARMQRYMRRSIVQTALVGEIHDGTGGDQLVLRRHPVISVSEVREEGVAVASSSYEVEDASGILFRRDGFDADSWAEGRRNWAVDYTAGYAAVPEDLALAATIQAGFTFRMAAAGGDRLGERGSILDAGGSVQYLTGPWAPGVLDTLESWTERRAG